MRQLLTRMYAILWFLVATPLSMADTDPFECLIVSGLKNDYEGAFTGFKDFLTTGTSAGSTKLNCRVFGSWASLMRHVEGLTKRTKILIVQAAHGTPFGASCDEQRDSFDDIIKDIDSISESHRVLSMFDTCYSGNLMVEKISKDQSEYLSGGPEKRNALLSRLKNQCIMTNSMPGFVSLSDPSGKQDPPIEFLGLIKHKNASGMNGEKFFSSQPQGLISSAAFSSSKLADIFVHRDKTAKATVVDATTNFQNWFDPNLMSNPLSCDPIPQSKSDGRIAKICAKGTLSNGFVSTLSLISILGEDTWIPDFFEKTSDELSQSNGQRDRVCAQNGIMPDDCAKFSSCVLAFLSEMKIKLKAKPHQPVRIRELYEFVIRRDREGKALSQCKDASTPSLQQALKKSESEFFWNLLPANYLESAAWTQFRMSMDELATNLNNRAPFVNIDEILDAVEGEKCVSEFYRFSPGAFSEPSLKSLYDPSEVERAFPMRGPENTTTQLLYSSFNRTSLQSAELSHPLDAARRTGCRDFIFP